MRYAVGQVWCYRAPQGFEDSRIIIGAIATSPTGAASSVSASATLPNASRTACSAASQSLSSPSGKTRLQRPLQHSTRRLQLQSVPNSQMASSTRTTMSAGSPALQFPSTAISITRSPPGRSCPSSIPTQPEPARRNDPFSRRSTVAPPVGRHAQLRQSCASSSRLAHPLSSPRLRRGCYITQRTPRIASIKRSWIAAPAARDLHHLLLCRRH